MSVTVDGVWFGLVIGFITNLYTQLITTSACNANANSHSAVHYSTYEVFSVCCIFNIFRCRLVTACNAEASAFMPLLAGHWSNWLTPRLAVISHHCRLKILFWSQSHIAADGQSISKSWCRAPSGAHDQIFITLWQLRSCFLGRPLWREAWSVFKCCWPSPA
jgi:hypothetical protein